MPDRDRLEDLGSSNHCFVNGRKVNNAELQDGDEVQFGSVKFRFDADRSPAAAVSDPREREALEQILDRHRDQLIEASAGKRPDASSDHFFSHIERCFADDSSSVQAAFDGVTPERYEALRSIVAASESARTADAPRSLIQLSEPPGSERELAKLRLLLRIGARLAATAGRAKAHGPNAVEQRMGLALDLVLEHVSVDRAAIVAIGNERRELRELASRARGGVEMEPKFFDHAIVVAALVKGGPVLNSDTGVGGVSADRPALHSALCVPLACRDAGLYVDNLSVPALYSEEDIAFLCQLATQLGPALENARLIDRLYLLENGSTQGR
jgi:hypothetical protein